MKLLVITQRLDPQDANLGFVCTWMRRLAARLDTLEVLTSEQRVRSLAPNIRIHSLGREAGCGALARRWRFAALAGKLVHRRRVDAILAHMCPEYVLGAAPYAVPRQVPMVLWYTHRQVTWQLRLAHRLVRHVVTAVPDSFPLRSDKTQAIGHGIDVERFQPAANGRPHSSHRRRMLAVGRLAPIKRWPLLLEALHRLIHRLHRTDIELAIVGAAITGCPPNYAAALRQDCRRLRLEEHVRWVGAVPHDQMPAQYQQADLVVNTSPPGLFDKVVLEAMACGVPVVVCDPAYLTTMRDAAPLLCLEPTPQRLAETIEWALDAAVADTGLHRRLRETVITEHSVDKLSHRLAQMLQG